MNTEQITLASAWLEISATSTADNATKNIVGDFISRSLDGDNMTIRELAVDCGIVNFDTAIPLEWSKNVERLTGKNPFGHIVWSYDSPNVWGQPAPITPEGEALLFAMECLEKNGLNQ